MERKTYYTVTFDLGDSADEVEADALISNFKNALSQNNILPALGEWGSYGVCHDCDEYVEHYEAYDRLEEIYSALEGC